MKSRVCVLTLCGLLALAPTLRAADEAFDFQILRDRAKALSTRPYQPRPNNVPASLLNLTYDEYRLITFDEEQTRWRRENVPFQLQYSHPGFVHDHSVQLYEVNGGTATPIKYSPSLFKFPDANVGKTLTESVGFAGFRVLGVLDRPWDELASFLGASYFRSLCMRTVYGLSARGLGLNPAGADGEEFPVFEEFWIERPPVGAKQFVIHALLNSPSVVGAYRFIVTPGAETLMRIKAVVYCRKNPQVFGMAPLTSMFWHGENSETDFGDIRPEVHDSDGLMMANGNGEWIWRPLTNPKANRVSAFSDENPRGFGLIQRDRKFSSYEDLEANYHLRPSAWIEPIGKWGRGTVRLAELPAKSEAIDNIVSFWVPERLPSAGEPIEFDYVLHWFLEQIQPPAGYAAATRTGYSVTHEPDLRRFVVDFDGVAPGQADGGPAIEAVVEVGAGATLYYKTLQKNPYNSTWRLAFGLKPDGSGRPVELRCFLNQTPHLRTETWSYLWNP